MGHRTTFPRGRQAAPLGLRSLVATHPETGERVYLGEVDPFLVTVPTVTLAAAGTLTVPVRFLSRGGLLIRSVRATVGATTTIRFLNDFNGHAWQDRALRTTLVTGTGQDPYDLPVPALVRPNSALVLTLADTGGGGVVNVTFDCSRLDPRHVGEDELKLLEREMPFFHSADVVLPAAVNGRSAPVALIEPTDADIAFECWDLQASDLTNGWSAEFKSASEGSFWGTDPTLASNLFGDGQRPGRLVASICTPGNETVQIVGTNISGVGRTVNVVLGGTKAWRP